MKIRQGYVSNSSSSSFIVSDELVAAMLRAERKKKLEKLDKILNTEEDVVSLHQEIFINNK